MEDGEKCICSEHELYNPFGDKSEMLYRGQRLTVTGSRYIAGTRFYRFKETDRDNWFQAEAFTPIRKLH